MTISSDFTKAESKFIVNKFDLSGVILKVENELIECYQQIKYSFSYS